MSLWSISPSMAKAPKVAGTGIAFLGDGKGHARIEGGIYENEYVREGAHWKIAALHYFPQYEGGYAEGWANVGGQDLPIVKQHFTPDETGVPVPPAQGAAPTSGLTLAQVETRIAALNDEDAVRNLQNAYGYYIDRKMWDDVVDLFAQDSAAEIYEQAVARGPEGVRKAIAAHMGAAGLRHGEVNDRLLFDTTVTVLPGRARSRSARHRTRHAGRRRQNAGKLGNQCLPQSFCETGRPLEIQGIAHHAVMTADYFVGWGEGGTKKHAKLAAYNAAMKR